MTRDTELAASPTWTGERAKPGARPYTVIIPNMPDTGPIAAPKVARGARHGLAVRQCTDQARGRVMKHGYHTMMAWEPRYLVLHDDGKVVDTTSLADRQSRAVAARCARGTVVAVGLGLGTFLHEVARNPDVERVFAVDPDPRVVGVVRDNADRYSWKGIDKVLWVCADGADVDRKFLADRHDYKDGIDFLFVDRVGAGGPIQNQVEQVRDAAEGLYPYSAAFWGQELVLVDWLRNGRSPPLWDLSRMNLEHFDEWCLHVGVNLVHRSVEYLAHARTCWAVQRAVMDHDAFETVMGKGRRPGPMWVARAAYVNVEGKTRLDNVWVYAENDFVARRLAYRVLEDDFAMARLLDMRVEKLK